MTDFNYTRDVFRKIEQNMIDDALGRTEARANDLSAAWRDVEDALPDGWVLDKVYRRAGAWSAWALNTNPPIGPGLPGLRSDGETPAVALFALSAELRDYRQTSRFAK